VESWKKRKVILEKKEKKGKVGKKKVKKKRKKKMHCGVGEQ
jgi:hypothetical protein